ncbi:MAG: hypothetical protein ACOC44_13330 [Promethearchaeia archaeon]
MTSKDIAKILIIIGGLIGLIEAIMSLVGNPLITGGWFGLGWVSSVIALIISLAILFSCFKPDDPIPYSAIVELILGILLIIFGSLIGGILVIIGAILLFLD